MSQICIIVLRMTLLWNSPNLVFSLTQSGYYTIRVIKYWWEGMPERGSGMMTVFLQFLTAMLDQLLILINKNQSSFRRLVAAFPPTNIWWLRLRYELKSKEARMSIECWPQMTHRYTRQCTSKTISACHLVKLRGISVHWNPACGWNKTHCVLYFISDLLTLWFHCDENKFL